MNISNSLKALEWKILVLKIEQNIQNLFQISISDPDINK